MALTIGPLAVDPPVVLAPMAGVTNAAFRRLCRSYGGGLYVSEMVSARAVVEGQSTHAYFAPDEDVRSVQLVGVDPLTVREAVRRMVDEWGVHHVDLNMGCPARKVTRRGGGAALPVRVRAFAAVVHAAVEAAAPVPVTVKMRTGIDGDTVTYLDAGRAAEAEGAAAVTLHARSAAQLYSGEADWTAIAALKAALAVPVLGNGDIWVAGDAVRMTAATGCDGVVIGRGCLGRPWLFRDLADALAGRPVAPAPVLGEVVDVMRRHARMLADLMGEEAATRDFRKHVEWYLTGYAVAPEHVTAFQRASTLAELETGLAALDPAAPMAPGADAAPRGTTSGPQRVALPEGWLADRDATAPPPDADLVASGG